MAHIDLTASFFAGTRKSTGLFEAVIVSCAGLAVSVFLIAAHWIPAARVFAAP